MSLNTEDNDVKFYISLSENSDYFVTHEKRFVPVLTGKPAHPPAGRG